MINLDYYMQNKTILITGANGEIGQNLISQLSSKIFDNTIIALDLNESQYKNSIHEFIKGSILDSNIILDIFTRYSIDVVFHLAAILSTKAEENPHLAKEVNLGGSEILMHASLQATQKIKFFFPSSIAVYNTANLNSDTCVNEDLVDIRPITIYGQTKLACENIGVKFNNYGFDFRCIRFPGIISASTMPTGGTSDYAPEMIHYAAQNKKYN